MGGGIFSKPTAAGDNLLFVRLRWVLFLWILVDISVHYQPETWLFWAGCGIAGLFGLSQIALWKLPPRFLKGMWLFQTIFLLDLFFTVATLYVAGQAEPRLLVVMFLTLFITALVQKLSLSLLVSGIATLGLFLLFGDLAVWIEILTRRGVWRNEEEREYAYSILREAKQKRNKSAE
jgi:hypothetical protein